MMPAGFGKIQICCTKLKWKKEVNHSCAVIMDYATLTLRVQWTSVPFVQGCYDPKHKEQRSALSALSLSLLPKSELHFCIEHFFCRFCI